MIPETVTLTGRRNVPFVEEYQFTDDSGAAIDFTGCTGAMQIRLYGNAPGAALASLANVSSDVEGVWINDPTNGVIQVKINEATLNGLPTAATPGAADVFAYDLVLTWPDALEECLIEGRFVLKPGVTR
jgi:hypothetical protein